MLRSAVTRLERPSAHPHFDCPQLKQVAHPSKESPTLKLGTAAKEAVEHGHPQVRGLGEERENRFDESASERKLPRLSEALIDEIRALERSAEHSDPSNVRTDIVENVQDVLLIDTNHGPRVVLSFAGVPSFKVGDSLDGIEFRPTGEQATRIERLLRADQILGKASGPRGS